MNRTLICASITEIDLTLLKTVEKDVDLWEIRMDLIGRSWPQAAQQLKKPWIACNRCLPEGGKAGPDEDTRINDLLGGIDKGASIVDIELSTKTLDQVVPAIKNKCQCQISYHNLSETPSIDVLSSIVEKQIRAGADICKIVTTARSFEDNLRVMHLLKKYPDIKIVAFAMGVEGRLSRVLAPLAGAYYTFASLSNGKEAAPGQISVAELKEIYQLIETKNKK